MKSEDVWNGNECEKNRGGENLKAIIVSTDYIIPKKLENAKYFDYLGRIIENDRRYTREIKSMIIVSTRRAFFSRTNLT